MNENSFLWSLLWSDIRLGCFLFELRRVVEDKFELASWWIVKFEAWFSIKMVLFVRVSRLIFQTVLAGFLGSRGPLNSSFKESGGSPRSLESGGRLISGVLLVKEGQWFGGLFLNRMIKLLTSGMFSIGDCFFYLRLASLEPWKVVVMDWAKKRL